MKALCAMAKDALGPAWPAEYDAAVPALFDIFCRATGTTLPGTRLPHHGSPLDTWEPYERQWYGGYAPATSGAGRVWLVVRPSE